MPQGHRKTPFSGKAKKEQLKAKKHGNSVPDHINRGKCSGHLLTNDDSDDDSEHVVQKINAQPSRTAKGKTNNATRYALQFFKETREEVEAKKEMARREIQPVKEEDLEISIEDYFPSELDFPIRPPWDFEMSRKRLDAKEQKYFREYVTNLESKYDRKDLSLFELNLETWRQLWRVLEMSDIVLIIVDIRFPVLMFPPSLYRYVVNQLKKEMILVLNKVDLAPAPIVVAWHNYFKKHFPSLQIVMFTSFPGYNILGNTQDKAGLQQRRRKGRLRMAAEGSQKLLEACKEIVKDRVDLSSWQTKVKEEMEIETDDDELVVGETIQHKQVDTSFEVHEKFKGGVLTIGCVGQPNVGKSSLMNAVMGKKVVSVSKTPGHTKHFQTIFLTPNVRLCDCPGLVFPSRVPKALQVIMGSYPIAQLRDPYSVILYIAERLNLVQLLRIPHPENDTTWSAMDICDGWALKRGYKTARTGRLDSYRSANSILRMALDGKITLCLRPPGYLEQKNEWEGHKDIPVVKWIQARLQNIESGDTCEERIVYSSDEEKDTKVVPSHSATKNDNSDADSDSDVGDSDDGDSADDEGEYTDAGGSCKGKNRFLALND